MLFPVSLVAGGFGEAYVPMKVIVSGDAAATAANIKAYDFLLRLGFAGFLWILIGVAHHKPTAAG